MKRMGFGARGLDLTWSGKRCRVEPQTLARDRRPGAHQPEEPDFSTGSVERKESACTVGLRLVGSLKDSEWALKDGNEVSYERRDEVCYAKEELAESADAVAKPNSSKSAGHQCYCKRGLGFRV